ncbi:MAG: hypothetical protein J6P39_01845, partial [Oscillospiraceae bacterium]|nr:hypothetical protein [Oscillospiraceae bacterium]
MKRRNITAAVICLALILVLVCVITVAGGVFSRLFSRAQDTFLGTPSYPAFTSSVDKDGDGTDDQTDVLQGAKDYIATEPQYKSIYY